MVETRRNSVAKDSIKAGALSHSARQIVEGAVGSFLAHLCPLFPKGRG
jgi:hypothetical protein